MTSIQIAKKDFKVMDVVRKAVSYYDKSKIIFTLNNKERALIMIIINTGTLINPWIYRTVK